MPLYFQSQILIMRLRKLLFTVLALPFSGLLSCSEPAPDQPVSGPAYFDVPAFIDKQIAMLSEQKAGLQKTVSFQDKKAETSTLPTVNWTEALQNFRETDLNKKALSDAYTVTNSKDPSGLHILYLRKPKVNAPVKSLEIITDAKDQVKMLRAVYEEDNALFYNQEIRELHTGPNGMLKQYRISGAQKVILFDPVPYKVEAAVRN
jgi:serine protease inhibitor ecotin